MGKQIAELYKKIQDFDEKLKKVKQLEKEVGKLTEEVAELQRLNLVFKQDVDNFLKILISKPV